MSIRIAGQNNGRSHAIVSSERSGSVYLSEALCGKSVPHVRPATEGLPTCKACTKRLAGPAPEPAAVSQEQPTSGQPATVGQMATTVPAPGQYLVQAPSRGSLVHSAYVGSYVSPTATPEYRVRGTDCGQRARNSWVVTAVGSEQAPALVTCPRCLQWATFRATATEGALAEARGVTRGASAEFVATCQTGGQPSGSAEWSDDEWSTWLAYAPVRRELADRISNGHGLAGHNYGPECVRCVAVAVGNGTIGSSSPDWGSPAIQSTSASPRAVRIRRRVASMTTDDSTPVYRFRDAVVSPSAQLAVAAAYNGLPEVSDDSLTQAAYAAFAAETLDQYRAMRAAGIFHMVTEEDPYTSAADMIADVERGTILTLATATTGAHPFLSNAENDAFRAIHDVFGHAATGRGFDRHGEEAAYQSHAVMYSLLARRALATETRGQNAAMIAAGGTFQPQKLALLPEWATSLDALQPSGQERYEATEQARQMHSAAGLALASGIRPIPAAVTARGVSHLQRTTDRTVCGIRITSATGWSLRPLGVAYVSCDHCRRTVRDDV